MSGAEHLLRTVPAGELTDAEVAAESELRAATYAEVHPQGPVLPPEMFAATTRQPAGTQVHCLATAGTGRLVGFGVLSGQSADPTGPASVEVDLGVDPGQRRHQLGTRILHALAAAAPPGVQLLRGATTESAAAAEAFAAAVGATVALREHVNVLDLDRVDPGSFRAHAADVARSAPDYAVDLIDGVWPEDRAAGLCRVFAALSDAPTDDLALQRDTSLDPDRMRQKLQLGVDAGMLVWTAVATHRPTGLPVALHQLTCPPGGADVAWVPNTVVLPEHRGHRLGLWLKAFTVLRLTEAAPTVRRIETKNADSNAAMLKVNEALGYRRLRAVTTWQLPRAAAIRPSSA